MLRVIFGFNLEDKVNMEKLRKKIGMFSVNQLNCYHVLVEAFNVINYGSSHKIQEKWMPNNETSYSNRRMHNVKVPKVDHVKCEGFTWYGAKMWNQLPEEIKSIKKPKIFQARVKQYLWDIIPSYWNIHEDMALGLCCECHGRLKGDWNQGWRELRRT